MSGQTYFIKIDTLTIHFLDKSTSTEVYSKYVKDSPISWIRQDSLKATFCIMRQGASYLKTNFLPDISDYDLIKGYRADDSYFSFAQAFLSNQISYLQLQKAMKLGKLGEQIVLKSQKSFNQLEFKNYEIAEEKKYYSLRLVRMEKAKAEYKKSLKILIFRDSLFVT